MRRRALLAASGSSGEVDWSYELHLTPEWVDDPFSNGEEAEIYGNFSELHALMVRMVETLGKRTEHDNRYTYELYGFPPEFNFTVDGARIDYCVKLSNYNDITFNCGSITGTLYADCIYLSKY